MFGKDQLFETGNRDELGLNHDRVEILRTLEFVAHSCHLHFSSTNQIGTRNFFEGEENYKIQILNTIKILNARNAKILTGFGWISFSGRVFRYMRRTRFLNDIYNAIMKLSRIRYAKTQKKGLKAGVKIKTFRVSPISSLNP